MKKRSESLEPPFTFFIDRCLGKGVVPDAVKNNALRDEAVEILDDHYTPNAKDADWLAEVGQKGWVVLSQDRNITRNPLEQQALLNAKVAFFGLARGDAPGPEKAESLGRAIEGIRRALSRFGLAIIATVSRDGDVTVKWADGKRLKKPRLIAARKSKSKS